MAYLLDSDVFIQAKNLHYGFDFCPAFWDWLVAANSNSILFSIERVGDEIRAGNDDLSQWAMLRGSQFFVPPDASTIATLGVVSQWANSQGFQPAAVSTFLTAADYYLVAEARAHGHVVVTHERAANSITRIKIPNACVGMGITCVTPFEMLRREGALFVLAS